MSIPAPNYTYAATLLRVTDGDTIDVRIDQGFRNYHDCTLRIDGIQCPEPKGRTKAAGLAATAATVEFLGNRKLVVRTRPEKRKKEDGFRRWLAEVWAEGQSQELGEYLLATGHATPFAG